jgi:hypothetical protein
MRCSLKRLCYSWLASRFWFCRIVSTRSSVEVLGGYRLFPWGLFRGYACCHCQAHIFCLDLNTPSSSRGMRVSVAEHKWLCLDALLSTCALQRASETPQPSARGSSPPKAPKPFLTEGQLLDVLEDISDGLESAGESYLTHMLRCARFLIEMGVVRVAADRKGHSEVEVNGLDFASGTVKWMQ